MDLNSSSSNEIQVNSQPQLRTNDMVEQMMFDLWETNFDDVPRQNLVLIKFGRYSARRLGSIKWATERTKIKTLLKKYEEEHRIQDDKRVSIITLTKHYQDIIIPETVVKMTVAHEMVHYAHGFHSPLPKLYEHPHRGNIVNKELVARGLKEELEFSELWLKENWSKYINNYRQLTKRKRR